MTEQQYRADEVYPTPAPEPASVPQYIPQPWQQQPYQQFVPQPYVQVNPYSQPYQPQPYQPQPLYQQQPYQLQEQYQQSVAVPLPQPQPLQAQSQPQLQYQQPASQFQQSYQGGQTTFSQAFAPQDASSSSYGGQHAYQYAAYPPQWQQGANQLLQSNSFILYFVLAILEILFCGGPFAIPALIYAVLMNGAYGRGDGAGYTQMRKATRIWLIVAFCIGVVVYIAYFMITAGESGTRNSFVQSNNYY